MSLPVQADFGFLNANTARLGNVLKPSLVAWSRFCILCEAFLQHSCAMSSWLSQAGLLLCLLVFLGIGMVHSHIWRMQSIQSWQFPSSAPFRLLAWCCGSRPCDAPSSPWDLHLHAFILTVVDYHLPCQCLHGRDSRSPGLAQAGTVSRGCHWLPPEISGIVCVPWCCPSSRWQGGWCPPAAPGSALLGLPCGVKGRLCPLPRPDLVVSNMLSPCCHSPWSPLSLSHELSPDPHLCHRELHTSQLLL